jgi:nitrogen regulatory protein P-II 1
MKKIEAIIRTERLEAVKLALEEMGYPGMTIMEVKGHGKGQGEVQQWRGREYHEEFVSMVKMELVILDEDLSRTLNAITRAARTGETGDGKIFILPVEGAVRVRTGDRNENAI